MNLSKSEIALLVIAACFVLFLLFGADWVH